MPQGTETVGLVNRRVLHDPIVSSRRPAAQSEPSLSKHNSSDSLETINFPLLINAAPKRCSISVFSNGVKSLFAVSGTVASFLGEVQVPAIKQQGNEDLWRR